MLKITRLSRKDCYDELVSGKDEIDNVTVSYNYLHDSWKTSLWGSRDSNACDRRITFLGNHWQNVNSGLPLFRFGQTHVANNYYENVLDAAINSRMGTRIRIDGNYFESLHNPIVSFYSKAQAIGVWLTTSSIASPGRRTQATALSLAQMWARLFHASRPMAIR